MERWTPPPKVDPARRAVIKTHAGPVVAPRRRRRQVANARDDAGSGGVPKSVATSDGGQYQSINNAIDWRAYASQRSRRPPAEVFRQYADAGERPWSTGPARRTPGTLAEPIRWGRATTIPGWAQAPVVLDKARGRRP